MKTLTIHARITPELKTETESILSELGLTLTQAITLFLQQVRLQRGLPFALQLPPASSDARATYLAALPALAADWDTPTEDAAWADL